MKDCLGNELHVGDQVICSDMNYADLLIGEIIGFTPKKARIRYVRSDFQQGAPRECLKEPYQIFRRNDAENCTVRKVEFDVYDRVFIIDKFDVVNNYSVTYSSRSNQIQERVRECFITQIGIINKSDDNHLYRVQPVELSAEESEDQGVYHFWEKSWYGKELYKTREDAEKALRDKNKQ